MGCPFCALSESDVDKMTDEEADKLYTDGDPSSWCFVHTLAAAHIRKMAALVGKGLVRRIVRVKPEDL